MGKRLGLLLKGGRCLYGEWRVTCCDLKERCSDITAQKKPHTLYYANAASGVGWQEMQTSSEKKNILPTASLGIPSRETIYDT